MQVALWQDYFDFEWLCPTIVRDIGECKISRGIVLVWDSGEIRVTGEAVVKTVSGTSA
jgi:hypothetical protein